MSIHIRRSETTVLTFQRKTTDGEVIFDLPQEICFTVKKDYRKQEFLLQKRLSDGGITFDAETGWYRILILPEDTEKLDFGKYYCDLRKTDPAEDKYLMPMTEIVICPVVTWLANTR